MRSLLTVLFLALWLMLTACTSVPKGVSPVDNFDLSKYLGTWYEVARFDHSFERGLSRVTAEYRLRDDGGVEVINRGYNDKKGEWDEAIGKAYMVGAADLGHLKVSFFGPFYASYVVMALDHEDYQYALVTGPNRDFLWLLARSPVIAQSTKDDLLRFAEEKGYATEKLIFVEHVKDTGDHL